MTLPAQEPFTGAAGNLADPPWALFDTDTPGGRNIKKDGSGRGTVALTNGDCFVSWDADTFNNDHYSQYVAKFTGPGDGSGYLYLLARCPSGSNQSHGSYYWFWTDGGSDTALLKVVSGGAPVSLGTANATTFTTGDVFKIECIGTAIKAYKNGSAIISVIDTAVTSGVPCQGGYGVSGTVLFDDWQGDNTTSGGGGGGAAPPNRRRLMGVG